MQTETVSMHCSFVHYFAEFALLQSLNLVTRCQLNLCLFFVLCVIILMICWYRSMRLRDCSCTTL